MPYADFAMPLMPLFMPLMPFFDAFAAAFFLRLMPRFIYFRHFR